MIAKKLVVLGIVLISGTAWGQAVTTPIFNWSYQRHASTAAEGFLNGQANYIQAAGQANYFNSVAAVNYEEARGKAIDNYKKYVTTYHETRLYNKEMRDRYAKKPLTREQLDRINTSSLPEPLTTQQYDRTSGKVTWPHILRTAEYEAFRSRIDELIFARSPENDGDGSPFQREVASLVDAMRMLLRNNIYNVTDSQYSDARAFLRSLDYEVKQVRSNTASVSPVSASVTVN